MYISLMGETEGLIMLFLSVSYASAKILEREGSISSSSYYGQLLFTRL